MKLTVPVMAAIVGMATAAPSTVEMFKRQAGPTCEGKFMNVSHWEGKYMNTKTTIANVLSCHWTNTVDSCCSPKYGLVVLALQWMPGFGPNDEFTVHGKP